MIDDADVRVFTFSDVRRHFMRGKRRFFWFACAGAALAFLSVFAKGPKYKIDATFKEGSDKSNSDGLKELFSGAVSLGAAQPQASSFMRSYAVLRPLVEQLGLQARAAPRRGLLSKVARRFCEVIKADQGWPLEDTDPFQFQNVKYDEEKPIEFALRFVDGQRFELLDGKRVAAKGKLGEEVRCDGVVFTLARAPKNLRLHSFYPLEFRPWVRLVDLIQGALHIKSDKVNKSIYALSYYARDRHEGVRIVNGLMSEFRAYLKREHDQLAQEQLSYLKERQQDLYQQLIVALDAHSDRLRETLGERGFLNLEQEMEIYVQAHQKMRGHVMEIDIELKGLEEGSRWLGNSSGSYLSKIQSSLQELEQQRDLLEISLSQSKGDAGVFEQHRHELETVREERRKVEDYLAEGGASLPWVPDAAIAAWAEQIRGKEIDLALFPDREKSDFADYLSNRVRLLSVREKILQDRLLYQGSIPSEFEGIDLETSRELFSSYNRQLDEVEAAMRRYDHLQVQLKEPTLELGSLGAMLQDPMSQNLISQAAAIGFHMKDEKYRSAKEAERGREELDLQRKVLSEHVSQLHRLEEIKADLIREKISGLQRVTLDCVNRQVSILYEQVEDYRAKRREMLLHEKGILEQKMGEIRSQLSDVPQKWQSEFLLNLKTDLNKGIMQSVTQIVESKTMSHQLHHVESKALDLAVPPLIPHPPKLLSMMLLGACAVGFGAFGFSLIRLIFQGFPASPEQLKALKFPYSGEVSTSCDGFSSEVVSGSDLESIRRLCLFADAPPKASVLGILGGRGPDFSFALAALASKMGRKVCLLRADFESAFRSQDAPGFLQMLEGNLSEWPMRQMAGFDCVPSGGYSRFGTELIQSARCKELIDSLKARYDLILLYFRSPLEFAESRAALQLCDKAVVSVRGERIDVLTPFGSWAYHEGGSRLTFVATDVI